jgi:hypothetical protein
VVVVKQPLTTAQVTTVVEPALGQTVPVWFMHTAGGVGQTQAALGRLPWQVCGEPQA